MSEQAVGQHNSGEQSGIPHAVHDRRLGMIFAGLLLAVFVSSLSETVASTALPTIVGDLGGVTIMQWVTTAYILTSTITMPIYGKLGDVIGRKYLLISAVILYALGKVFCWIAPNMGVLITGRAISGIGGGGIMILSETIIADIIPPRTRGVYLGIMGAVLTVANVVGPLLGGWMVDDFGWRSIFAITIPLAVLAIIVVGVYLHPVKKHGQVDFDWRGSLLLAVGVTSLVLTVSWGGTMYRWFSWQIIGLMLLFIVCAGLFIYVESRERQAILPMSMFRNRNFVLVSVVGMLMNIAFLGTLTYLPTYFQIVDRLSPAISGLVIAPMSIGILITSTITGWLAGKTDHYKWMLIAMCAVSGLGFFMMSTITIGQALVFALVDLFVLGLGIGLGIQIVTLVVQNEFSYTLVGTATAANNFFKQIGSTLGASLIGVMFVSRLTHDMAGKLPRTDNISLPSITPSVVDKLPVHLQDVIATGYSEALIPIFRYYLPLMCVCLVLMCFVKNHPLATTVVHGGATGKKADTAH